MTEQLGGVFARTLFDEWSRAGVVHAVLSPGSRSTPLALAAAEHLETHVFHDERSAAFFALGVGMATGVPAVTVCTSGTAGANAHPAVVESDASRVPLVVCTADRPPELRSTGANQTIDQNRLFGQAPRWFFDPGVPDEVDDAGQFWRSIASRAYAESKGPLPGPVHLNLPFREPFDVDPEVGRPIGGRPAGHPWTRRTMASGAVDPGPLAAAIEQYEQGLILVGQWPGVSAETLAELSARSGWPVLADPLSGLRARGTITTYDALLRNEEWAATHYPLAVLRIGRPVTSKIANRWLEHVYPHFVVTRDAGWLDPHRAASHYLLGDPDATLRAVSETLVPRESEWAAEWRTAEASARVALDAVCDGFSDQFEGRIARDVVAATPAHGIVFVGSSMPVRDVESFAAAPVAPTVYANRGASGIDGTVSTALGAAVGSGRPVVCLLGDVAFLHDSNGLIGAGRRSADVTYVVVDNDGGGIFHFLPQAGHPDFERLFATPHGLELPALAAAVDLPVVQPGPDEVGPAVADSIEAGGVRVIHVPTTRDRNVEQHREVWAAVAAAIGG